MFVKPRCFKVNATRVSWDFICTILANYSCSLVLLAKLRRFGISECFYTHPPPLRRATRPTFPFSVLRPSIFANLASHINSAEAVSGCTDSENGLRFTFKTKAAQHRTGTKVEPKSTLCVCTKALSDMFLVPAQELSGIV